jgi:hypothetical protein
VVVATVGDQHPGLAPRPTDAAADGWDRIQIQQRNELGDVVAVAAGHDDGQWDAGRVGQDVVLGVGAASVDCSSSRRVFRYHSLGST